MKVIVYNPGDYNIRITDEGVMCNPHTWAMGDEEVVTPLVEKGRALIVNPDSIHDEGSNPVAMMVKSQVADANMQAGTSETTEKVSDKPTTATEAAPTATKTTKKK